MKCFFTKTLIFFSLFLCSCAVYPSKVGMKLNHSNYVKAEPESTKIVISTWDQKAWLLDENGKVCLESDVSTGVDGRETPAGKYHVLEKLTEKQSNLYGRLVDEKSGEVVIKEAWNHKGEIPQGLVYKGIAMPYWLRLTWDGIGMHEGEFEKRIRSSFGCIRVYKGAQSYFYEKSVLGTAVEVVDHSLVKEMYYR
jgi:hypothetical protein